MTKEEKEAKAASDKAAAEAKKNTPAIQVAEIVQETPQSKEIAELIEEIVQETPQSEQIAELIEEKRVLESKLDQKTQELQAKNNDLTSAIKESEKQSEIIDKLMDQVGKPIDSTKASVEIEGVVFVVTEENKTVKSIYHGAVPVKIENFTAEMVEEYVASGLLEEQ